MVRPRLQTASIGSLPTEADVALIDPAVFSRTIFSPDRSHRYTLFRRTDCEPWELEKALATPIDLEAYCAIIGMNPSGADSFAYDRTVRRARNFARYWGFQCFYMLNALSIRTTSPKGLYRVKNPNGRDNDKHLRRILGGAKLVVCAWGTPIADFDRIAGLEEILRDSGGLARIRCFGRNANGTPVHPLYQKQTQPLVPYFQ